MKSVQETFDNYYGRARTGKWETKTGKSTKTPNFIPKISRKKEDSKIDASLLQNSQWADTFVVDLPFMNRWELLTPIEKGELQQKTILLDLRTDKLTSGDSTYLKGFKNVLSKKALKQESDAINHIFQRIESYCNKEGKRLTEADITPSFIDDFIEMVIEKEYDILTAPTLR